MAVPYEEPLADDAATPGLPAHEISAAGLAERYRRGETPHTIHVWWARRPHAAMRALVDACLPAGWRARDEPQPRVLDMFGGGGTIAFEASRLGAAVDSIDNNELAVLIQRALLELPRDITDLPALVRAAGEGVLHRLRDATAELFPRRAQAFAYLWTYSTTCESCGERLWLGKRPWLAKKGRRRIALVLDDERPRVRHDPEAARASVWHGRTPVCPACSARQDRPDVRRCRDELVAEVGPNPDAPGKQYLVATPETLPSAETLRTHEARLLRELDTTLPTTRLPAWSGVINPALYGIATHADVPNPRQRVVLLTLVRELRREHGILTARLGARPALAVTALLSALVDQLVDWSCRLSMWIPQNEQVGRAFCGPGVAMLWDYAEIDPVGRGPANLWAKLDRIVAGTAALSGLDGPVRVHHADARALPFEDDTFDAVVTDPPYYDNVFYAPLADFFFVWKRLVFPPGTSPLLDRPQTNLARELVASTHREGSPDAAHRRYVDDLAAALGEAERVMKPDGTLALVYGHGSMAGWEAVVDAYRRTDLALVDAAPLSVERRQRPRAMGAAAVNTCVALVARGRPPGWRTPLTFAALGRSIDAALDETGHALTAAGWEDRDAGMAVFAKVVAQIANAAGVIDAPDDLLGTIAARISARLPGFRILLRRPL